MAGSRDVDIRGRKTLFDDFFKIDELDVSHRQNDGVMSPVQRRLVFDRGDSAAILLFNTDTKCVVLVNQFRAPTLGKSPGHGWLTEAVAGMVNSGEPPEITAIREALEETGYKVGNAEPIARFFSSPGGTSERIHLFYAEVTNADKIGNGGGVDDEDIEVRSIPIADLFKMADARSIEDPKLLIGALWLRQRLS